MSDLKFMVPFPHGASGQDSDESEAQAVYAWVGRNRLNELTEAANTAKEINMDPKINRDIVFNEAGGVMLGTHYKGGTTQIPEGAVDRSRDFGPIWGVLKFPLNAKFLAQDSDGRIYSYEKRPILAQADDKSWIWLAGDAGDSEFVALREIPCTYAATIVAIP